MYKPNFGDQTPYVSKPKRIDVMAVQKSRKSRSKRNMRRSHDSLVGPTCSADKTTGVLHLRHHISKDGFYRGQEVVPPKIKKPKKEEAQE